MQPPYTTVFDIARDGAPASSFLYIGFGAVAVGMVFLSFRSRRSRVRNILLLTVWSVLVVWVTRSAIRNARQDFLRVTEALTHGSFVLVEGVVTHYRATSRQGQAVHEFDVNNHHYSFAPYRRGIRSGRGLPKPPIMRDGSLVRIADLNGVILRLEIRPSPLP